MANPSKRKGTAAESLVVSVLVDAGWPYAERRALNGSQDRGDVAGVPGVVVEVKAEREFHITEWLREAAAEKANDGAEVGAVWFRLPRTTDPRKWAVCMDGQQFMDLLAAAGYR